MDITLRPATEADLDTVFAWVNDPETRAASFHSVAVPYEDHVRWFRAALTSASRHLFLAERPGVGAVAVVRFDRQVDDAGWAEISLNVDPGQRGQGVGAGALKAAAGVARGLRIQHLLAFIRPDNAASVRTFERACFVRGADRLVRGVMGQSWVLEVAP